MTRTFDFEKAATRIGLRMTIDGSGDDQIKIQGVPDYTFTDSDGGEAGIDEGMDPSEQTQQDASPEDDDAQSDVEDADVQDDAPIDSSDEEPDDTEMVVDTIGAAPEQPPDKFQYVDTAPPMATDADQMQLVGKHVLHAWDAEGIKGWFRGK